MDLNSLGAKIKLRLLSNSDTHPNVYKIFKITPSPKIAKNIKYSPVPISISRTFSCVISKPRKKIIKM